MAIIFKKGSIKSLIIRFDPDGNIIKNQIAVTSTDGEMVQLDPSRQIIISGMYEITPRDHLKDEY